MTKKFVQSLTLVSVLISQYAFAENVDRTRAVQFKSLFLGSLPLFQQNNIDKYIYDDVTLIKSIEEATTIDQAMKLTQELSVKDFAPAQMPVKRANTWEILGKRKKPVTLVIVPGIFGEFIPNRPFEEVLSKKGKFQAQFAQIIKNKIGSPLVKESRGDLSSFTPVDTNLDEVIHVSSIDDKRGRILARVVFLNTPFASLETLGDVDTRAIAFNRRLQKYIDLTGDQDLVLVGYSRGLNFALSMASIAQKNNEKWLQKLKGVVSLGGVVFGTALVDDAQSNESKRKVLAQVQDLAVNLKEDASQESILENTQKINQLLFAAAELNAPTSEVPFEKPQQPLFEVDQAVPLKILAQLSEKLGLFSHNPKYTESVKKFKILLTNLLVGVNQLSTQERLSWWAKNTVPTQGVIYYSLPGIQSDFAANDYEKQIYQSQTGYSLRGKNGELTADDAMLLGNHREYTYLTKVKLNDSQVSVAQASFLPKVISQLNPNQAPMNAKFLGLAGTHHWGLALQVVNPMLDKKRINPFPRKALLMSIAAQVTLDFEEK